MNGDNETVNGTISGLGDIEEGCGYSDIMGGKEENYWYCIQ